MSDRATITAENDVILPYPGKSAEDAAPLDGVVIHDVCDGWADRRHVTRTHDVIVCRQCSLRVAIPLGVRTWGDLRIFFRQFIQHRRKEEGA